MIMTDREDPEQRQPSDDKRLQRALEHWQPKYLEWWRDMGPGGLPGQHESTCAPRSAWTPTAGRTSTTSKMPDYRWGIFLAEPEHDRRIGFGDYTGSPCGRRSPASSATRCAGSS